MNNYKIIGLALTLLVAQPAFAAVEYFRFEGILFGSAEDTHIFGGPDYGFVEGQLVVIDFAVDTVADVAGMPDVGASVPNSDFFQVTYLDGPVAGAPVATFGVTETNFSGSYSQLYIDDFLWVGFDDADLDRDAMQPDDLSIATWAVGGGVSLYFEAPLFLPNAIGNLLLTYRSTTPFATAIPLPASWLLFAFAFTLVRSAARLGSSG